MCAFLNAVPDHCLLTILSNKSGSVRMIATPGTQGIAGEAHVILKEPLQKMNNHYRIDSECSSLVSDLPIGVN
jgi:hypothetical protein